MRTTCLVLAFVVVGLPTLAAGQGQQAETQSAAAGVQSRMIDDWAYVPVTVVQGPYATTFVSSTTGIGNYTLDLELELPADLAPRTQDLEYIALLQRFDAQVAFLDRFAVRALVMGEGIIPDDGSSAFSLVLNGTWGAGGGLVAQLLATERLRLSLTADYQHLQRTLLSPASALETAAAERRFGDLFTRQDIDRVFAGGSLGYAINDWFGFVAEAEWQGEWAEATGVFRNEPDSYHFAVLAGAVNVNFWEYRVPVGATAFWRERIPVGGENPFDYARQYGGGVFYTGRPYLDFGVELFGETFAQETGSVLRNSSRLYIAPRIRGYF